MVLYQCKRCGYEVEHRGNFLKHLNPPKMYQNLSSVKYKNNYINLHYLIH